MARPTSISTSNAALLAAIVIAGASLAARFAWTCDDAFISYRYAENLVDGLGLVFNAGERVEGYTNFLWTLLIAAGMKLGVEPERWSIGWGIAFHAGTLALLGGRSVARGRAAGAGVGVAIPAAALAFAVHEDAAGHATSGLETAMFVFFVLAGFLLAIAGAGRPARLAAAGAVFGMATLTRPDGALFGVLTAGWVLLQPRDRKRGATAFGAAFALLVVPFLLWRHAYYGDWVPNTFHAKSANVPWVEQGWWYARIYFAKYGALLAGPLAVAGIALAARRRSSTLLSAADAAWRGEAALALVLAVAHIAYVVRVGGDFMYARMLLPATPLLLVTCELAIAAGLPGRPLAQLVAALALAASLVAPAHPLPDHRHIRGIVNERLHYTRNASDYLRRKGETLRALFAGLPVRVAFLGAEARIVYYAKVPVAIECASGLTDRTTALQPLERRGRIGHEKHPSVAYLTDVRRVQIGLSPVFAECFGYADSLMSLPLEFNGTSCALLRWEPELADSLARRGATFPDFPRLHAQARASGAVDSLSPRERARIERFSGSR